VITTSLDELWNRLEGLRAEELRSLSPESLAKFLGVDPRELPLNIRMELARRLYNEYGLPQRWIASRPRMSLRDVSKALKPKKELTLTPPSISSVLRDLEVVAKAIMLIRECRARNPNDLVLELKIPLDDAEELYRKIMENEGLTNIATIEAVAKISRYVREVEKKSLRVKEILEKAENIKRELEEKLGEVEEKTKLLIEGLKYLNELQAIPALAKAFNYIELLMEHILPIVEARVKNEKTRCAWIDEQGYCTKWHWPEGDKN